MRKKGYRGARCEKRKLSKCKDICRTYDGIQYAYANILEADSEVIEFCCNVPLEATEDGEYCSDFVITLCSGDLRVRECVHRKHLTKPLTVKLLDLSREYWNRRGVQDWGLVIDAEK